MRQQLAELFSYMDETRDKLVGTAQSINPAFAGVRPKQDGWTAEENLAHLAIVEDRVSRLVAWGVDWAKTNGIGPETSDESIMSSLDEHGVADATVKMQAPPTVAPPEGRPIDESLTSLAASRPRLKEALIAGQGLDLSSVKRGHQALGDINLYQWALFVAQHEERHRRQIEKAMGEVTAMAAESAPIV
jgi:hypothetical protein